MQNYPGFSCPLCRAYSNLEASVAVEENEVMEMLGMANNSEESSSSHHQREKTVFAEDEVRNFTLIQNLTIILSN
jgi:hypothetical protein